ncbi:MAG TPA: hypothetical protein VGA37_01220 [Gemmatimonadales bacterium]
MIDDTFIVRTCTAGCNGTFDAVNLPPGFTIQYLATEVRVGIPVP